MTAMSDPDERAPGSTGSMGDGTYEADIAITEHGVVHVTARDWGSLGFGQGWGCARDNLGVIADQITKALGERSRYWGRGVGDVHVAGDLGYSVLDLRGRAPSLRDAQPDWIRELVAGYTAGYNLAVRQNDPDSGPDWFRGAPWVREIDELDLWTHLGDVTVMASGRNLVQLLGRAEAPGPDGPVPASPADALGPPPAASNGWALGGDLTASGAGMVLANPHFPWYGEARFWECHLRIPGTYDVYGVSLLGAPGVQMGFNASLAWTHTFSRGHRFTVASLELDPTDPTRYRHGDEMRSMRSRDHSVEVADTVWTPGGPLPRTRTEQRTLWSSHHGPMLNMPLLGWGTDKGFTYRDANIDNTAVIEQFLRMGMSSDIAGMRKVFHEVKGLPWVNTLAADSSGEAWYTDASATPLLSTEAQSRFRTRVSEDLIAALMYENRIALLDGSDPGDDWQDHPDARSAGLEPPGALPEIETRGVVLNANDSHWMNSPGVPLEGYSVMGGLEATPRTLRTRQNLALARVLAERGDVILADLLAVIFDNASLSASLLRDSVVERVEDWIERGTTSVSDSGHEVSLAQVREVLVAWDGAFRLDSVGAALWREFMAGFPEAAWIDGGALFAEPFDSERPIDTPCGLAPAPDNNHEPGGDPVLAALAGAVRALDGAGIALNAPLGQVQWADRGAERVPVHGGGEGEGMMNVLAPSGALPAASLDPLPPPPPPIAGRERTGLRRGGYRVSYGTSFLMAVELLADGPKGVGLLAYGQSSDPASPHHRDGTDAYAAGEVRPLRFTDEEIAAAPGLSRLVLRS